MLVLRLADCERVLLRCGWWGSMRDAHPRGGVGIVRGDGWGGCLNYGDDRQSLAHTSTRMADAVSRLPLILSVIALVVALLGATPLGEAAGPVAAKVVPFAKRAGYATNSGAVNGIRANRTPTAGRLVPLDAKGKLPEAAIPARAPAFARLEYVYGLGDADANGTAVARATCPEGKKLIGGGYVPNIHLPEGYVAMTASGPSVDKSTWIAKAMEVKRYDAVWEIEAWAVCATVTR